MERTEVLETSLSVWKTDVLPLYYARKYPSLGHFQERCGGSGAGGRNRIRNLLITKQWLYQLSYASILMGRGPGFDPERLHSIVPGATASPSAFMHPAYTDGKRWVANPPLSTLYVDFEGNVPLLQPATGFEPAQHRNWHIGFTV